jgi:hypothetical protein
MVHECFVKLIDLCLVEFWKTSGKVLNDEFFSIGDNSRNNRESAVAQ